MHEPAPFLNLPFAAALEPWMLAVIFAMSFAGSLLFVPWALVNLPADYFRHDKRQVPLWGTYHPAIRLALRVGKNLLGVVVVLTGVTMLILPGQGLLTMLIGVMLLDFPGKFRSECWLVKRRPIRRAVNWLRKVRHRPPFELD